MNVDLPNASVHLDPTAWVAPGAYLLGDVRLGPRVSVWFNATLRGDGDRVLVGDGSNVQEGCALHTDPGFPLTIGADVSVGHRAVLHGCTVEDEALVGMGAIVMNGAVIGAGSIIGAGAVIPEGTQVPANSLVVGIPGRVRGDVSAAARAGTVANARLYVGLAKAAATAVAGA
ncbi:MAG: gamma carbonic anhydrase family protein [Nocardioidaceae bacterium]|nr:gamma carbonic anhydrase family protein [Nocardioidaceae bacterium]